MGRGKMRKTEAISLLQKRGAKRDDGEWGWQQQKLFSPVSFIFVTFLCRRPTIRKFCASTTFISLLLLSSTLRSICAVAAVFDHFFFLIFIARWSSSIRSALPSRLLTAIIVAVLLRPSSSPLPLLPRSTLEREVHIIIQPFFHSTISSVSAIRHQERFHFPVINICKLEQQFY